MPTLDLATPARVESNLALARSLEDAFARRATLYAEARASLQPELGVAMAPVAGGVVVFAGRGAPVNRAFGLGLRRAVTDEDIDRVEDFFHARRKLPRLDVCPLAHSSLLEVLRNRGYSLERFWSALARPLDGQDLEPGGDGSIAVRRVEPGQEELWLRTVAEGMAGDENPGPEVLDVVAASLRTPGMALLLAWIDGQPAGGAGILIHEGMAECTSAGTRPAFRRRGVQSALLKARLSAAAEAGCQWVAAMVHPGTTSERNCQRAGFQLAYTKAVMVGQLPEWI